MCNVLMQFVLLVQFFFKKSQKQQLNTQKCPTECYYTLTQDWKQDHGQMNSVLYWKLFTNTWLLGLLVLYEFRSATCTKKLPIWVQSVYSVIKHSYIVWACRTGSITSLECMFITLLWFITWTLWTSCSCVICRSMFSSWSPLPFSINYCELV